MRNKHATMKPPPIRRRAGSGASDLIPLAPAERLLTASEVARMLHVSRNTVYDMFRRGELSGLRVRGSLRLRPRGVARYLRLHAGRRKKPRAEGRKERSFP